MAPTTPGAIPYTQAEDRVIASLLASTEFRTWVGASNDAEANARINCTIRPESLVADQEEIANWRAEYPRVKITMPDNGSAMTFVHDATGTDFEFSELPLRIVVDFLDLVLIRQLTEDSYRTYLETVFTIIRQAFTNSPSAEKFFASIISTEGPPQVYKIDNAEGSLISWQWILESSDR